jgi:hypothetical protein
MYQTNKSIPRHHRKVENSLHHAVYSAVNKSGIVGADKIARRELCYLLKGKFHRETRTKLLEADYYASVNSQWDRWAEHLANVIKASGDTKFRIPHLVTTVKLHGHPPM